jgi:hypothetical protein
MNARRILAGTAMGAALLTGLACSDSDSDSVTTPPAQTIVRTYILRTIGGVSLPVVIAQDATVRAEITDDEITLNADHSYAESGHLRVTAADGTVQIFPQADQGTYTVQNGAVVLTSSIGNGTTTGRVSGNTFTVVDTRVENLRLPRFNGRVSKKSYAAAS